MWKDCAVVGASANNKTTRDGEVCCFGGVRCRKLESFWLSGKNEVGLNSSNSTTRSGVSRRAFETRGATGGLMGFCGVIVSVGGWRRAKTGS